MMPRIQLPADFRWWRAGCVLVGLSFPLLSWLLFDKVNASGSLMEAAAYAIFAVAGLGGAGIFLTLGSSGVWSRPFGGFFGKLFYPEERLTRPPDDLIRALRERLRNRYWASAAQQIDALETAYGKSTELFYLRAHLTAGRTGDCKDVTCAASRALSERQFERYLALLRRDPPVVYV